MMQDGSAGGRNTNRNSAVPGRRLRGACDFCTKRRRKCDGDGINACSLCKAKNQACCRYSVRLPTGPRRNANANAGGDATANSKRAANGWNGVTSQATDAGSGIAGSGGVAYAPGGYRGGSQMRPSAAQYPSGAAAGGAMGRAGNSGTAIVSLKRARLSPSPATGLVGMRENDYIADYFRTMGFIPLTDESIIRKAMINTMFNGLRRQSGGIRIDSGDSSAWGGGDAILSRREDRSDTESSTCTLWSTIALGALVQGQPTAAVADYVQLARQALANCFDCGTRETARAYAAMALVHDFLGDEAKFLKYTMFARNIVDSLPADEVPQDLSDTLLFIDACDMFRFESSPNTYTGPLATAGYGTDGHDWTPSASLKAPRIWRRNDMCRYMLKTDVRLGRSFFADMKSSGILESGDEKSPSSVSPVLSSTTTATTLSDVSQRKAARNAEDVGHCPGSGRCEEVGVGNVIELPPPGECSRKFAEETWKEFGLLEEAADSPEISGGVGGLYFNSIAAYVHVLQGRVEVAFEKIVRCAKVIERNPGLLRFSPWSHLGHCVLAVLAATRSCTEYERVRIAYNTVIEDPDALRAPPIEEWQSMQDVCDSVFCGSLYSQLRTASLVDDAESETSSTAPSMMHRVPNMVIHPPPDTTTGNPSFRLDGRRAVETAESVDLGVRVASSAGGVPVGPVGVIGGQEVVVEVTPADGGGKPQVVGAGNGGMGGLGGQRPESYSSYGTASTDTIDGSQRDVGPSFKNDGGAPNCAGGSIPFSGAYRADGDLAARGDNSVTLPSPVAAGGAAAQAVAEPCGGYSDGRGGQGLLRIHREDGIQSAVAEGEQSDHGSLLDAVDAWLDHEFLEGFDGASAGVDDDDHGSLSPLGLYFGSNST